MKRVVFMMACMMTVCVMFGQTHWTQPTNFLGSVTANSVLVIDGVESVSDQIEIGAFCGDECRGAALPYGTLIGGHRLYFLSIGGNTNNEVITFRLWDHEADEELEYECQTTVTFADNMQLGTYPNWFEISFTSPVTTITQTTTLLGDGTWNRFGLIIEVDDPIAMLEALEEQLDAEGVIIETATGSTECFGDGFWWGTIDEEGITNEEMLFILIPEGVDDITIQLEGMSANPALHPIEIVNGSWNRIGFPYTEEVPVEDALADFEAVDGDFLEGPNGSAEYYDGLGWWSTFENFVPGEGYWLYSGSEEDRTLIYSTGAKKTRNAKK